MRKVGLLSDAEHLKNRDFKQTQLAERELIASRLPKARGLGKKLKYTERVPTRVPGGLVRDNLRSTLTGTDGRERLRGATGGPPAAFPPHTPELVSDMSTDSEPEESEDTRLAVQEDTLESPEESDVEIEDTRLAVREDALESPEESDVEFEDTRLTVQESPEESEAGFEDALTPTESDAESVVSLLAPTEIESDGDTPELVSENSTDDDFASADELEETPPEPTESEPESEDTLPDRAAESEDTLPDRADEPYEDYESEDTLPDRAGEPYENYESEDTQNRGETYYDGEPYDDYKPEDTDNRKPEETEPTGSDPTFGDGYDIYDSLPSEYKENDRRYIFREDFNLKKRPNDNYPESVKRRKTLFEREMLLNQTPGMDRIEPRQAEALQLHLSSEDSIFSRVPAMDRMAFSSRMAFAEQPVLQDAQTVRDQPTGKKQKTSHHYQRDREMPSMPSRVEAFQRPRLGNLRDNRAPQLPIPLATPRPEMLLNQTPGMDRTEPRQAEALQLHLSSEDSIPSRVPAMDRMAFGRMAFAKQPVLQNAQTIRDQPPVKKQKTFHQYQRDREMPSMPSRVEAFQRPRLGNLRVNTTPQLPIPLATPKPNDLWTPLKRQKLTDDQWVLKQY